MAVSRTVRSSRVRPIRRPPASRAASTLPRPRRAGGQDVDRRGVDDAARRAYETRIRDLQEEVDDAELALDLARTERAQAEPDTSWTTYRSHRDGGRTWRASGTAERAAPWSHTACAVRSASR